MKKQINPESPLMQLLWMTWHIHEFVDVDGREQYMWWDMTQKALAEMGIDRQDFSITMTMYQEWKRAQTTRQQEAIA